MDESLESLEQEPWKLTDEQIIDLDKRFIWHPFTQMSEWTSPDFEPVVITSGRGAMVIDIHGNEYIDGNASIWTNIHGHCHPRLNAAVSEQLGRIAHTSFLGFTHPTAAVLARELVGRSPASLTRVFFSDDGSTANEVALRMAIQFRQIRGESESVNRLVAFDYAYHGDTYGAASLGSIPVFTKSISEKPLPVTHVSGMEELKGLGSEFAASVNAAIIEPLMRGPAGMRPWPAGMLRELREWCTENGVLLILDEVMTGFGRTGTMFACEQEEVAPDFLNIAKGITGGYLPMAATLTTDEVFETFLGDASRTFYYGHSYTANPLACAAALASLAIFDEEHVLDGLPEKASTLRRALESLGNDRRVVETRQRGLASAIEVRGEGSESRDLEARNRLGAFVCTEARRFGLLTRPIGNSVIFLPPLCISSEQIESSIDAVRQALEAL